MSATLGARFQGGLCKQRASQQVQQREFTGIRLFEPQQPEPLWRFERPEAGGANDARAARLLAKKTLKAEILKEAPEH